MRTTPFHDSLLFLIGDTPDHNALGSAKYLVVALYALLLMGGIAIAVFNWSHDPAQRNGRNAWIWLFRTLIGTMWLQGSLWKLPLPVAGAFQFWTSQMAEHSAFPAHAALIRDFFLPNIAILDPLIYLTETMLAIALMLGFAVRLASLVAIVFTLNIWIGLYHHTGEWPWQYMFLVMTHAFFALDHAGRSLGLDAILARARTGLLAGQSAVARAYRLAS